MSGATTMSLMALVGWARLLAAAEPSGNGTPWWPWVLGGLAVLAVALAVAVGVAHRGDEVRYRNVSDARSFSGFSALVQRGSELGLTRLQHLAEGRRRVSVGVAQLASPDAPLRFTLYRGPGRRGEISTVISGEGAERTILVESGDSIATVRASRGEVRRVLEHLVDDIKATGDDVSAAALNRWLG